MAHLIFAQAKSIRKKVNDAVKFQERLGSGIDPTRISDNIITQQRDEFREILKIATLLHADYREITQSETTNWFFISVRPKPSIAWKDFYDCVYKYVNRNFMISYKLSFEQKSIIGDGNGFHVHIVCDTKHRSKGECLRDTISSFRKVCEENCVDVQTTKNPNDIVNNYLINYASEDEHKAPTKEGDIIWRQSLNLENLYENNLPLICLSSPKTDKNRITPAIASWD